MVRFAVVAVNLKQTLGLLTSCGCFDGKDQGTLRGYNLNKESLLALHLPDLALASTTFRFTVLPNTAHCGTLKSCRDFFLWGDYY